MKEIHTFQEKVLRDSKAYILREEKKHIDVSSSPLCFLTIWAETPGKYKLLNLLGSKNFYNEYFYYLKNILSVYKNNNLYLFYSNKKISFKSSNLIISYSKKENFDNSGKFKDEYFQHNSKDKTFFWLLISLDNYVPKNIEENVAIIANSKSKKNGFFYFLNFIFNQIIFKLHKLNELKHFCWEEYDLSRNICSKFSIFIKKFKFKKIILNYEAVPFQNKVIDFIKEYDSKIKTYGYLHCAPWPLQTDLLYRGQKLDYLIVSGSVQKEVLKNKLGWKKKSILLIPSLRFKKIKKKQFNNFIFIPFKIDKNNYLVCLKKILNLKNKLINKNIKVRIHPLNKDSKDHLLLRDKINSLLKKHRKNLSEKSSKYSIFLGSATGVCVQALEEGNSIIHVPNNIYLDCFTSKMWKNIIVKKIDKDILEYKIKKKNTIFHVNSNNKNFKKYFLPLIKRCI